VPNEAIAAAVLKFGPAEALRAYISWNPANRRQGPESLDSCKQALLLHLIGDALIIQQLFFSGDHLWRALAKSSARFLRGSGPYALAWGPRVRLSGASIRAMKSRGIGASRRATHRFYCNM
jgi:hypothetical protein